MYNSKLLDGFVVFVEVVESGSFTIAAEKTHHSTSYISKEVTKLEERLGVRLLQRTTRVLKLTPEGEHFYQQARDVIDAAKAAEESISGSQTEPTGVLKITCPVALGLSTMTPIFTRYAQTYPKVSLDIDLSDKKIDVIEQGIDIAIRASDKLEDSSLISRKLFSDTGVTIASPQYLKSRGTPIHPRELTQHDIITYSYAKNPKRWSYQEPNGHEAIVDITNRITINSAQMELEMCKAGVGITRLPRFYLGNEIESGELIELFSDFPKHQLGVYMVYPSRKHMSAKVRAFKEIVEQELGAH
ncbi:LysR family transcriptional regulator [Vibrio methylphosphonaticus]|uniref:LysR family transcriptional regulator n=1 Tax=Vibrio methylphosphonaticus TaxID=2946866 RepID=UPI002029E3D5|nr:LysR family transcriptional regulator [Vibrio methylphosphonaticus]MCL9776820.1 LysR family transcriptional regulator [Vibrio methylphosphonaticus]